MPPALAGPLERLRSALATISLGQKVVIGLLVAGLGLGGFFFVRWITAPTYAPLFSNLASTDASAIVDELNAAGTAYELADGGQTIMVAKDQVYDLRLAMSGKGLPAGSDTGYALLDEQGITTSEFQQQVEYQRAIEGELSKTLESLEGVRSAVVHVALPKDEVFATEETEPTASVLLDLAPGANLAGEQVQAVTNLVSSSIQDMAPDQVTVADSTGQVLSAAGTGVTAAAGDARSQLEQDTEARLGENAQQILDRVLGPGRAVVSSAPTSTSTSGRRRRKPSTTRTARRRSRRAPPPRATRAAAPPSAASSARRTSPTRPGTPVATPPTTRSRPPPTTPSARPRRRRRGPPARSTGSPSRS